MTSAFPATALSVNLNKVALVRNSRHLGIPSVLRAAELCLAAGAHGITVHPRPDARHIRSNDVFELAELLKSWPEREFNIEGNPFHNLMDFVRQVRPHQATFVPDAQGQLTSDHGWNLAQNTEQLAPLIQECRQLGVRVSLFMDPDSQAMALAKRLGADRVELYTEPYAAAFELSQDQTLQELRRYAASAQSAQDLGLGVNAGHDFNQRNLPAFLQQVPGVLEVSIGHALISDALEYGYSQTVAQYLECLKNTIRA
ncbi:MAG: pyridoxine 5'-phosphate synthase [Betaproteobacteria bacterium]|nr:pyridoxine 5'-phosphate synthase [Betaproteobacteria bacterium]